MQMIKKVLKRFLYFFNGILLGMSKKEVKKRRNSHVGEQCFIVGNGPSLCIEDLELIRGTFSFGTNRIYNIFEKTDWRPSCYCAQDYKLINRSAKEISGICVKEKWIGILRDSPYKRIKNANYIELKNEAFYPEKPQFAEDISDGVFEGFTVTYMCLQIAMYMGFSKIYLLGIDHNYSIDAMPDGTVIKNEGVQDHFSKADQIDNIPQTYKSTLAYEAARQYAQKHGIKIYNASRGGRLEVFERINIEEIAHKKNTRRQK